MRIVFIGAGSLASSLAPALQRAGHQVIQVYSRTMDSAHTVAAVVGAEPITDFSVITPDAELYIVALKDSVLEASVSEICQGRYNKTFIHTAGSVELEAFKGKTAHYGVLYPMQTFSRQRVVDMSQVPCFIEASDDVTLSKLYVLCKGVSSFVYELSSERRKYLHLAAVFACNFSNHCYAMAAEVLQRHKIPFSVMLPLIDETALKVHVLHPTKAQTGPAVRYDEQIIGKQLDMLKSMPQLKAIYDLMSKDIHRTADKI